MGVRVIISTSGEACSPPVPPAPVPSYNPSGYPWYQIGEGCPGQPPVAGLIIGRHRVIIATGGLDGCTGGDGTVTSVGLDLPSEFVVTGSPITGSGTFIVSKADQSANLVYASPAGISGQPIFRALVPTDLPVATASFLGVVKPDDSTITISDGVITAVGGGITQLTGDVTAGPGTGSQATTLKTVNSNVGSYTNANITVNAKGLITAAANGSGGSGTVSSIAMTVPTILSVSGSPITTSGTLALSLATQSANEFWAGPTSGSAATPTFRAIAVADLPVATSSTLGVVKPDNSTITISGGVITSVVTGGVTSVALTVPSWQTVSGSPITSSGTLAVTDNTQTANYAFIGPTSGSAAAPTFRAIIPADLPVATGSSLGIVKPDGSSITISGGVISATGAGLGTVTSVALSAPGIFTVSGSPVTSSGTLTFTLNTQTANLVFAGPSSGSAAAPTFRALATADLPSDNTIRPLGLTVDGGGTPPTTGIKGYLTIPFNCTVTGWTVIADQIGSVSFDVWFIAGSGAPPTAPNVPTSTNKISASAPVAISSAQSAAGGSSAISTWNTSLSQWGTLAFNLSSVTTCTRISVQLQVQLS